MEGTVSTALPAPIAQPAQYVQPVQPIQMPATYAQSNKESIVCGLDFYKLGIALGTITFMIGSACVIQGYHLTAWLGIIAGMLGFYGGYNHKRAYLKAFIGMLIFHAPFCTIIVIIF